MPTTTTNIKVHAERWRAGQCEVYIEADLDVPVSGYITITSEPHDVYVSVTHWYATAIDITDMEDEPVALTQDDIDLLTEHAIEAAQFKRSEEIAGA